MSLEYQLIYGANQKLIIEIIGGMLSKLIINNVWAVDLILL
jgi:hypothetical protein